MEYEVTTTIQASPEQVWAALSDVEHWSEWTDSITWVKPESSPFGPGGRATVKQPRFPASRWVVDTWVPGQRFTWTSRSGGVTTVADHELAAAADGTTSATLRIRQSGLLAGLVDLLVGKRARRYVDMEAAGLKRASEDAG